jgi:hypothetical protein
LNQAGSECVGRMAEGGSWVDLATRQFADDATDLSVRVPGGTIEVARSFEFGRWNVHVADPLYSMGVPGTPSPVVLNGRAFTNLNAPIAPLAGATLRPGVVPL